MIDLKKDYFADSEIVSLLQDGSEDGKQTVEDFLYALLSLYEKSPDGETLSQALVVDWHVFADDSSLAIVLGSLSLPFHKDDHVEYKTEFLNSSRAWEDVKNDVKTKSRFFCHLDSIADVLDDFDIDKDPLLLFKGDKFYRARVHHKEEPTFKKEEMGCPTTPELATPGRANPRGISYLYLCSDDQTPFYEVRPYYLDRVDIGEFLILVDNVRIIDFTEKVNLFKVFYDAGEDTFRQKVKRRVLFDAISSDLSKPLRSFDSELEYVPTQFICEFFKDIGADGLMFKSSVRNSGKNLVLFYPEKAECVEVHPYEVNKISVGRKELF
jgi:hypothetical protein